MAGTWRWPHLASRLGISAAIRHATFMACIFVWRTGWHHPWSASARVTSAVTPTVIRLLELAKINSNTCRPLSRQHRARKPCDGSVDSLRRGTGWNLWKLTSLAVCCSLYLPTRLVKPVGHPSLLLLPTTEIVQVSELRHTIEIRTVTGQWKVRTRTDRYSHCDTTQLCTRSITCWHRSTVKCASNGTASGRKAYPLQADSVSCR